MRTLIIILIFGIGVSCKEKGKSYKVPKLPVKYEQVEFEYYNSEFQLDSSSGLRTDGFYEVKEIFGTYTTDLKNYHPNKPSLGFVHFFENGFCRVGSWNGIRENSAEVEEAFKTDKGYVFYGLYKIQTDTIKIEYLYNPASPGAGQSENRNTLVGLIKSNRIEFITDTHKKFSYPTSPSDSLTSSCIGRFVKSDLDQLKWSNYLKENITEYIKNE